MKISDREKNFLLLGGGVLLLVIIYQGMIIPILAGQAMVRQKIVGERLLLAKSNAKIAQKERLEAKNKALVEKITRAEKRFLPGETPSLAAAELQKILKKIANRAQVNVSSEKIISPIGVGEYQKIPVRVTLKCLMTDLKNVLYHIENNRIALLISETKIKLINSKNPSKVEATLTVAGIIKKKVDNGG